MRLLCFNFPSKFNSTQRPKNVDLTEKKRFASVQNMMHANGRASGRLHVDLTCHRSRLLAKPLQLPPKTNPLDISRTGILYSCNIYCYTASSWLDRSHVLLVSHLWQSSYEISLQEKRGRRHWHACTEKPEEEATYTYVCIRRVYVPAATAPCPHRYG